MGQCYKKSFFIAFVQLSNIWMNCYMIAHKAQETSHIIYGKWMKYGSDVTVLGKELKKIAMGLVMKWEQAPKYFRK